MGNLVQAVVGAPVLTTIVSQDGIYADFDVDEQTYLQTIRASARGNAQEQQMPVQLVVQGDNGHVYNGFIESFDNRIDPTSDTIRARARFANTDGALRSGHVRFGAPVGRDGAFRAARAGAGDFLRPEQGGRARRRRREQGGLSPGRAGQDGRHRSRGRQRPAGR